MDLGIAGRKAIVCASSKGLGKGCALALAEAGCEVVMNGRDARALETAAAEIAARTRATIIPIVGDVGTEAGRKSLLAACAEPDILVNNNGGPPPKDFREITRDEMIAGLDANMITPIALIQSVIDGMAERGFGRVIDITSASVRTPLVGLDLSSGARAGLTAFLAAEARRFAERNVTINHLLPGVFDTERSAAGNARMAAIKGVTPEEFRNQRRQGIPAKRFGTPEEFGKLCAFLASAHAGFITGQSILIDGGAFPTVF